MEQLLQRYIRGEVSEEERLKVASWLDESPENMREFLALRNMISHFGKVIQTRNIPLERDISQYKK